MNSRHDRGDVLIAAQSGRALAVAARRSGYRPLVADQFADLDTRRIAARTQRVSGKLAGAPMVGALRTLSLRRSPIGLVLGSGFEDRPAVVTDLARRHRLLGNTGQTLARVKDPIRFAALCARCGVPHPETRRAPAEGGIWLLKRQGGAGGDHIAPAGPVIRHSSRAYAQRQVAGSPVSALFLAAGGRTMVLGFSEQWADPTSRRPFRYGGAVRPAGLPVATAAAIVGCVERLCAALGLVGLNSADCLVRADGFDLLEINPRPGATLDIFRDRAGLLFQLHVAACHGRLPRRAPDFPGASGAAIVYAPAALDLPAGFAWPEWTADRQPASSRVPEGGPVCTVLADADDAASVRPLLDRRRAEILARVGAAR